MLSPEEKANELIESFMEKAPKMDDHSIIYESTAKLHAIKCCNEVLGFMGADRGTAYWMEVLEILKNK